jgi:hypothetical protein
MMNWNSVGIKVIMVTTSALILLAIGSLFFMHIRQNNQ